MDGENDNSNAAAPEQPVENQPAGEEPKAEDGAPVE